jgi:uncharacterized protein YkwD
MKKLLLFLLAAFVFNLTGCPSRNPSDVRYEYNISQYDRIIQELLQEHNEQRRKNSLSELAIDADLVVAAQKWAKHMCERGRMYHGSLTSKVDMKRWSRVGENIAQGQKDAREVVDCWMHSRGHRNNILNSRFSSVGFGYAENKNGQIYWCTIFGG